MLIKANISEGRSMHRRTKYLTSFTSTILDMIGGKIVIIFQIITLQVLLLNRLGDRLVVYCANSHISIYQLFLDPEAPSSSPSLAKIQDVDASALSVHPACVVSIMLTHLRTETGRQRSGDQGPGSPSDDSASLIMNVSGRLVLIQVMTLMVTIINNNNDNDDIQRDSVAGDNSYQPDRPLYSPPTVLAGSCEQVWLPSQTDTSKPHLTLALW